MGVRNKSPFLFIAYEFIRRLEAVTLITKCSQAKDDVSD